MTKQFLTLLLGVLLFHSSYSQNDLDAWDKNYKPINLLELLKFEKQYADSIEKDKNIAPYFSRIGKYRFKANFLGKTRKLSNDIKKSMRNVYKLYIGDPAQLDKLIDNEVLFEVDGQKIWMPIQKQLEEDLKTEMKKGNTATLYCLLFNEHKFDNKLYNTFLISEFIKEE